MGEVNGDFDGRLNAAMDAGNYDDDDDERVHEWELGLPNVDDITPLTQGLIPAGLLSAFNIKPEPYRTSGEVTQASEDTLSLLRGSNFKAFCEDDGDESETKKQRRNDSPEDADSAAAEDGSGSGGGDGSGGGGGGGEKAVKRPRLVWTPQLHKRFVDVVGHLGIKNAVPKTIMQLMNVEGLTRENVASHLQKYRLYLKRMQGGSFDGGSNSSSENNGNSNGNGNGNGNNGNGAVSVPVMPMGMMGMGMMGYNGFESHHNYNHNHSHQQSNNNNNNGSYYSNNHSHSHHHHQYSNGNNGMMMMQSGNKYGSFMSYHHSPHVGPSEN